MATRITATEAARNFSDILNRVRYRGESFIIERSGDIVAELSPSTIAPVRKSTLRVLAEFMTNNSIPDDGFAKDITEGINQQPKVDTTDPWER